MPQGTQGFDRKQRRIALSLFLTAAGFYVASGDGMIHPSDGVVLFHVSESLAQGRLDIDELPAWPGFGGRSVVDPASGQSRFYAKYGLGMSLVELPLDLLGRAADHAATLNDRTLLMQNTEGHVLYYPVDREGTPRAIRAAFASGANALVVGATLALLYLLLIQLGFGARIALTSAALVGIATPLWQAAVDGFSEPLGALGVVGCALLVRRSAWLRAGALLGIAVLAKPAHAVLAVPLIVLVLAQAPPVRLARVGIGALAVLLTAFAYNVARFGSLIETGYGGEISRWENPFWSGFAGLLASPGRGFLIYAPLWLVVVPVARSMWLRFRPEALYAALVFVVLLLTYSKWHMWEGGWCWGPRYLLPAVPMMGVPLAVALDRATSARSWRWFVGVVIAIAIPISWSGTRVDANDFSTAIGDHWKAHAAEYTAKGVPNPWALVKWDWASAPIARYWSFEPRRSYLLIDAFRMPGVILAWLALAAAVFLFGAVQCLRTTRFTPSPK